MMMMMMTADLSMCQAVGGQEGRPANAGDRGHRSLPLTPAPVAASAARLTTKAQRWSPSMLANIHIPQPLARPHVPMHSQVATQPESGPTYSPSILHGGLQCAGVSGTDSWCTLQHMPDE